jgi:hypothetical protein
MRCKKELTGKFFDKWPVASILSLHNQLFFKTNIAMGMNSGF